jgi:hypothetical protein
MAAAHVHGATSCCGDSCKMLLHPPAGRRGLALAVAAAAHICGTAGRRLSKLLPATSWSR